MSFTPEELEAMRLADEEIDREFADKYVADQVSRDMDKWLDELAVEDLMDNKSCQRRKYNAAYRESHRDYWHRYYLSHKHGKCRQKQVATGAARAGAE